MKWLLLALALVAPSQAGLRFGCSTISIERLDPLVEPGSVPSAHVHQIVGGNAFAPTMSSGANNNISETATCTSCFFSEDFSNYWTAVMYFKARNGTYKRVPIYANAQLEGSTDGMTIYYTQKDFNSNGNKKITAFPPGFRMVVGSPTVNTKAGVVKGLAYTCLQTVLTRGAETPDFPTKPCPAGIMAIHHFPSCWDGKNVDSPDHQSHMFSTTKGGFQEAGPCPASHPWSMGDSTGYATHGDYVFGWKGDSLQKAMDSSCMFQACGNGRPLLSQNAAAINKCKVKKTVTEDTEGWLTELPGRVM
ncbi:hypothetical protein IFR04_006358 [Cadophora malorum]|uniref:DUF1996 domain-containing protein n=1 Tax=Cadophora malorum TaxID=108018 RepID=A0A8H7WAV0_9HELO|nr:hypothetical protein IFR04_006358 [Cadophora malorum]